MIAGSTGDALRRLRHSWQLYVCLALPVLYLLVFRYYPMFGAQIAFKDYRVSSGIWGSPWAGFKHFARFFAAYDAWNIIRNTVLLSLYTLLFAFPFPIILALSLNAARSDRFRRSVQTITYLPYFISMVVMVGIVFQFLAPRTGIVNRAIALLGGAQINFMGRADLFRPVYVLSDIWQNTGYNSIVYLAALTSIDPSHHEAAIIDGASRWQRVWHVDFPGIIPTAMILLIMNMGRVLQFGFEKALLMQTPLNITTSEVLATYVYKVGIAAQITNFSYSSAVGLLISVVTMVLVIASNRLSRALSGSSLW